MSRTEDMKIETTGNAIDLFHTNQDVYHEINGIQIKIMLENSSFETPEYIHIAKEKSIIVIDYSIFLTVMTCGTPQVSFSSCPYYFVQSNCEEKEFKSMLKNTKKIFEKKGEAFDSENKQKEREKGVIVVQILDRILNNKEINNKKYYCDKPDMRLKTIKFFDKNNFDDEMELNF